MAELTGAEAVIRITGYKISGFPQQINARNSQGKDYWNPYSCASEFCKSIRRYSGIRGLLQQLPHQFYGENNLPYDADHWDKGLSEMYGRSTAIPALYRQLGHL